MFTDTNQQNMCTVLSPAITNELLQHFKIAQLIENCSTEYINLHHLVHWQGHSASVDIPQWLCDHQRMPSVAAFACSAKQGELSHLGLVYISVCLYIYLSVCLYIYLCVCISICLFVYLSVCLYIYLSACLPTCLPACLVSVCLSVCLSVCHIQI